MNTVRANLSALWNYRGFIFESVKREFAVRYQNSLLGSVWNILNPLAMIVVYTVIFSTIMRARLVGMDSHYAYSIYLCAGTLSWGLFVEILNKSQTMFIDHANILKKIQFPRSALLINITLSAWLNFLIVAVLFFAFLLLTGNFPGWVVFGAIPILIMQTLFAVGLGLMLGVINVFFRDVGPFFTIFLQFWFWFTPIVYPITILPARIQPYLAFNPMTSMVLAYQTIFVHQQWPQWNTLWMPALLTMFFCSLGLRMYLNHADEIVDEL